MPILSASAFFSSVNEFFVVFVSQVDRLNVKCQFLPVWLSLLVVIHSKCLYFIASKMLSIIL